MKTAIAFLTVNPHKNTVNFALEIQKELDVDVFIVVDDNTCLIEIQDLTIIQISDKKTAPFINSNISSNSTHIKKNPIAMDKFLYAFCNSYKEYDFVWVFEDDVFIPSVDTIRHLIKNYNRYDLVTPNHFEKNNRIPEWHWRSIFPLFPNREEPFYYSMICAMGLSRNMLNAISDYAHSKESLFYVEVMFNTLAHDYNLKVIDPLVLKSIVWKGNWGIDEFLFLPNNVFHPRKDIENHSLLRDAIQMLKSNNYKPQNNLPPFIQELL